jgi:hypothetical protein
MRTEHIKIAFVVEATGCRCSLRMPDGGRLSNARIKKLFRNQIHRLPRQRLKKIRAYDDLNRLANHTVGASLATPASDGGAGIPHVLPKPVTISACTTVRKMAPLQTFPR